MSQYELALRFERSFFGVAGAGSGSGGDTTLGGCIVSTLGGCLELVATLGGERDVGEDVLAVRSSAYFARAVRSSLPCERSGEAWCGLAIASVSSSVAAIRRSVGPVAGMSQRDIATRPSPPKNVFFSMPLYFDLLDFRCTSAFTPSHPTIAFILTYFIFPSRVASIEKF